MINTTSKLIIHSRDRFAVSTYLTCTGVEEIETSADDIHQTIGNCPTLQY